MMGNLFFKLTNSSEKYTEEHLSSLIEEILDKNSDVTPEYLIGCIRPYYPNVAINYSAFCEFVSEKYGISKQKKSRINYFFKLQNTAKEYTEPIKIIDRSKENNYYSNYEENLDSPLSISIFFSCNDYI